MKKMQKTLVVLTLAVAVMMTGASLASMQTNQNNSSNRNRNNNSSMSGNMNHGNMNNGNMNSNMAMSSNMSGSAMMMSDTEFANMAAKGGNAEIQMAQLALQKATNNDVKEYAEDMIKDHTKAGRNLDKVAAKKQMTLDKTPTEEQQQMLTQLQAASGAEFDRMYMEMAGVMAHQKMQAMYQSEISNGTDNDIKNYARKTLPTVQKHLRMAQQMVNGNMNGMNMNSNRRGN